MPALQKSARGSSSSSAPRKYKRDPKRLAVINRRNAYMKSLFRRVNIAVSNPSPTLETSHGVSWKRISLLGQGAFGSVFFAKSRNQEETRLPFQMAVKSAIMDSASSLKYEKQILCDLGSSPYIVRCYGDEITLMADGVEIYNLLLEFCGGLSLERQIRLSTGGLSDSDISYYATDILQGLKYIHSRGYIHCDVKPANILLVPGDGERSRTFVAKLADFGLAQNVNAETDFCLKGTYRYMSPELVKERVVDFAVDIWAFGCLMVEMMTGKPAWDYSEAEDLLYVIRETDQLPNIPQNATESAKDFLLRCLSRSCGLRWSAEMLLEHPFLSVAI